MKAEHPRASIIILVQHKVDLLEGCLHSIRALSPATPYEAIVLFNGTAVSEIERVQSQFDNINFLKSRVNLGFSGGNNFAARRAQGEYLVFLNDDTIPEEGWLDALVSAADRAPDVGAVGSRILFPDGSLQEAGCVIWEDGSTYPMGRGAAADSHAFYYPRNVDYCSANALLVRAQTFWEAGGFDEAFFPAYYEDVDLCMTIRHRLHKKILYEPRSRIKHFEGASSETSFRAFLFERNVRRIRQKWESELLAYVRAAPSSIPEIQRACYRARNASARVLVIDDRIPEGGLGSGFGRLEELVKDLAESDFATTFFAAAVSDGNPSALDDAGIELLEGDLLDHLSQPHVQYDVILISRPHNYERFSGVIHEFQRNARLIYDAEALFHRRLFMQAQLENDPGKRADLIGEAQRMLTLEKELARVCQRIVCISLEEEAVLRSFEGHCPIELLVPLTRDIVFGNAPFEERSGLVFVAGWLAGEASPNIPAIEWFVRRVFQHVQDALPGTVLSITGKNPPDAVKALSSDTVRLLGFVGDLGNLYNGARLAISPLTYGAGVKIKTIEALQHGVPVVATTVGAEGLGVHDNEGLDITENAEEFAARVVRLLSDREHWIARRIQIAKLIEILERKRTSWKEIIERTLAESRGSYEQVLSRSLS